MERENAFARKSGYRLLKNETGKRVSADAAQLLVEELERFGEDIAEEANQFAEHSGRKTIQKRDVRQAVPRVER